MTPESFNAQLAQRKLEAADILLVQAKRGSDADRIRAASAILRIAFMTEPKHQKVAPESSAVKRAPEPPQQSEEIPGDSPSENSPSLMGARAGERVYGIPNMVVSINTPSFSAPSPVLSTG